MAAHATGQCLLGEGDPAAALPRLRAAATAWQSLRMPYEAARATLLVGLACCGARRPHRCGPGVRQRTAIFRELGAGPDLERVDALSPGCRGAVGTERGRRRTALSDREREVLAHAGGGQDQPRDRRRPADQPAHRRAGTWRTSSPSWASGAAPRPSPTPTSTTCLLGSVSHRAFAPRECSAEWDIRAMPGRRTRPYGRPHDHERLPTAPLDRETADRLSAGVPPLLLRLRVRPGPVRAGHPLRPAAADVAVPARGLRRRLRHPTARRSPRDRSRSRSSARPRGRRVRDRARRDPADAGRHDHRSPHPLCEVRDGRISAVTTYCNGGGTTRAGSPRCRSADDPSLMT